MSRLNKTNLKVEKRRPFVNTSDKLNFDKKNAPYSDEHQFFSFYTFLVLTTFFLPVNFI